MQKCTILVTGCKEYRDVLENFEYFFHRYWRDCPYPIVLCTNDDEYVTDFPYDKVVVSSEKMNLVRMRGVEIETPYVIMMQDDHWLINEVDSQRIAKYIDLAEKYDCGNLRLIQDPVTEYVFDEKNEIMEYRIGQAYRISLRGGLWNTHYLMGFVNRFDNFWEMERLGQEYAAGIDKKVLGTKNRELPIVDAVHKGYYEDFAVTLLQIHHRYDVSKRAIMPRKIMLRETFKAYILSLNPELITKLQEKLNIGYKIK